MPTLHEFMAGFGAKELFLTLLVVVITVIAREQERIFRRKKR